MIETEASYPLEPLSEAHLTRVKDQALASRPIASTTAIALVGEVRRLREAIRDVAMWVHVQEHGGYLNDGEDHSLEACGKGPCETARMHLSGYVKRNGRWVRP